MKRFVRLVAGLLLIALAGAIAWADRGGWGWFLAAGVAFVAWRE
jgi:hypothetical protein